MRSLLSHRRARRFWRRVAPIVTVCFVWSFTLGPAAQALANRPPRPAGHIRKLSATEMQHILGATSGAPVPASPGSAYPWEGRVGDVNTGNGDKLTSISLFGWTAKGGLPVGLTLSHNSQSSLNSVLGQKWTFSFNLSATIDGSGNFTVHWGNDLSYPFTKNLNGSYSPPTGIHDSLVANGAPITSYDLTTPDQTKYHFTNPNGTGWLISTISDPNSNTITVNHNASNLVTTIVDQSSTANRTITLGYDGGNRINSITDPLNRQWTVVYNASNELTKITYPTVSGNSYNEQFAYDTSGHHDIVTLTDKRANNWQFTYNTDDSIATATDAAGNQTTYSYTTTQVTITDPNSHTIKHNYTNGLLMSVVDALSNTESYQYDASNNKTQVTDRRGKIWQYGYDANGNVTSKTDPLTHQWSWTFNSKNRLLTATDPLSHQAVNTYDTVLNYNLLTTQEKDSNGTVLATTTYTVNTDGTVATRKDNNNHTTTYGYDSNGYLNSVTTPNNRITQFVYNALGVRNSRTDALNRQTTYTLDNWERTTTTTYPDHSTKTFSFDANSNLTGWTDGNGTWARAYDADNRPTSETLNSVTQMTWTYDTTGKKGLLGVETDVSGRNQTYWYTARNEIDHVGESNNGTSWFWYDANGNLSKWQSEISTYEVYVYDNADRRTSVTMYSPTNTVIDSYTLTYNNDNQATYVSEGNGSTVTFGYDGQYHLTSEVRTGTGAYSKSYVVDGVGNRTSQTVGSATTSFTLDSDDELTATSSTTGGFVNSYGYNANGEQTSRTLSGTAYTLGYDYDGQLTSITQGTSSVSYGYDALGRRQGRTTGGVTTNFNWGMKGIDIETQGSTVVAQNTYGLFLVDRWSSSAPNYSEYPLYDWQGSVRFGTSWPGTNFSAVYDGFGQVVTSAGNTYDPYLFAGASGYRNDQDAGLVHVGARYYDAQVGRFVTRDTLLDQHPYVYCDGDPVNCLDPSGHNHIELNVLDSGGGGGSGSGPGGGGGGAQPKPKPLPYPWPQHPSVSIHIGASIGASVGVSGQIEGGNDIVIDLNIFWSKVGPVQQVSFKDFNDYLNYVRAYWRDKNYSANPYYKPTR